MNHKDTTVIKLWRSDGEEVPSGYGTYLLKVSFIISSLMTCYILYMNLGHSSDMTNESSIIKPIIPSHFIWIGHYVVGVSRKYFGDSQDICGCISCRIRHSHNEFHDPRQYVSRSIISLKEMHI